MMATHTPFQSAVRWIMPTERYIYRLSQKGENRIKRGTFCAWLIAICDSRADCPKPGKGRCRYIAERCAEGGQSITASTVSRWLRGVSRPNPKNMAALSKAFAGFEGY